MARPQIHAVSLNVEKGRNIRQACEWIADRVPNADAVFWQEMQPGQKETIAELLGMTGYAAAKTPHSDNDNAIFLKPGGAFAVTEEYLHPGAPWHAPANIGVRLRMEDGTLSPRPLNLVCSHACYHSAAIRLTEADWHTTLAKPGWLTIAAGDWNSYPSGEAPSDDYWDAVTDTTYRLYRTYLTCQGTRRSDDRSDRTLRDKELFVDPARVVAELYGRSAPLRPTTGYGKPQRGGEWRVDRTYLAGELRPTIAGFAVGEPSEVDEISDHRPTVLSLDRAKLAEIMCRPVP